jgi:DNA-binding winged helix-turn-helix (wHTH) protein
MIYTFGGCVLDTHLYTIQRAGQTIRLRPKVFHILLYLLEHRDRVIPKDELSAHVWPAQFISAATLESTMRAVRQALGDTGRAQHLIQTLPGRGYRFVGAVEVRASGPTHWDASAAPHGPHDASAPLLVPSRRSLALPAAAPVDPRSDAAPSPSVLSGPSDVSLPPAAGVSAGERKLASR